MAAWDVEGGRCVWMRQAHGSAVLAAGAATISGSGTAILSGCRDGTATAWKRPVGSPGEAATSSDLDGRGGLVGALPSKGMASCAAVDGAAGVMWLGGRDGVVRAWVPSSGV